MVTLEIQAMPLIYRMRDNPQGKGAESGAIRVNEEAMLILSGMFRAPTEKAQIL